MKTLVTYPDAEIVAKDYLKAALALRTEDYAADAGVGISVPRTQDRSALPFVQVAWDGTPTGTAPVTVAATIRVTAWHRTTTQAKALASLCQGLLLAHPGDSAIASVQFLTGVLPVTDPDTGVDLASITVRMNLRAIVL